MTRSVPFSLHPPRFPTLFAYPVNAIACQQLTLTQGRRLFGQVAEAHGPAFSTVHRLLHHRRRSRRQGDLAGKWVLAIEKAHTLNLV